MEQVSPFQCLIRIIQLEKDLDGANKKLKQQEEVFVQIFEAILRGQILLPHAEAAFEKSRNDLDLAIKHFQESINQEERQSSLAYLEIVRSTVRENSARLENLTKADSFLEEALDNCRELMKFHEEKASELENECHRLADLMRFSDIKIRRIEDVEMALLLREKAKWRGKIRLADGLEIAQKFALMRYIGSTDLVYA